MTRVLITGAAGFIGSHLAERLAADGHEVVGLDNLLTGRRENWPAVLDRDIRNISSFIVNDDPTASLNDSPCDLIVHCAASYSDREKWHRDADTNVQGSINVAIAALAWGCPVVYFQTALIYGNNPYAEVRQWLDIASTWKGGSPAIAEMEDLVNTPLTVEHAINPENSYAISKYAGGQYLRHSGVPLLELRLANIYGPRNLSGPVPAFYKRLSEGQPCTVTDSRRDFVYIQDLVDLVTQAIKTEATGTYHVSTGRDYAISEVFTAVTDAMELGQVPHDAVPRGDDDAPTILLDPSDTVRDFSWRATTDLDEGVAAAVEWYAEHGVEQTFTHLEMKERA